MVIDNVMICMIKYILRQIYSILNLLDRPIIEFEITLSGVNEDNFDSLKSNLTVAVANSLAVNKAMVSLTLNLNTEKLKRSGDTDYVIKASIEVPDGFDQDQLTASISDSESFVKNLNDEVESNPLLGLITAKAVGEPVVTEERTGRSFYLVYSNESIHH